MTGIEMLSEWINRVAARNLLTNEWLFADDMKVYVHKDQRYISGERITTLTIANITVYNKGKGIFTAFLEAAHTINPWDATFVECVLTERLANFLTRQGFTCSGGINFYLLKDTRICSGTFPSSA